MPGRIRTCYPYRPSARLRKGSCASERVISRHDDRYNLVLTQPKAGNEPTLSLMRRRRAARTLGFALLNQRGRQIGRPPWPWGDDTANVNVALRLVLQAERVLYSVGPD